MIEIVHKITPNKCSTSLRMPGKPRIKKTWYRQADNSFMLDGPKGWEDENLPEEVIREIDRSPVSLCNEFAG